MPYCQNRVPDHVIDVTEIYIWKQWLAAGYPSAVWSAWRVAGSQVSQGIFYFICFESCENRAERESLWFNSDSFLKGLWQSNMASGVNGRLLILCKIHRWYLPPILPKWISTRGADLTLNGFGKHRHWRRGGWFCLLWRSSSAPFFQTVDELKPEAATLAERGSLSVLCGLSQWRWLWGGEKNWQPQEQPVGRRGPTKCSCYRHRDEDRFKEQFSPQCSCKAHWRGSTDEPVCGAAWDNERERHAMAKT